MTLNQEAAPPTCYGNPSLAKPSIGRISLGLDIYVGSFTRYHARAWENVVAQASREMGAPNAKLFDLNDSLLLRFLRSPGAPAQARSWLGGVALRVSKVLGFRPEPNFATQDHVIYH